VSEMIDEDILFEFRKWAVAYGGYSEVTAKKDVRDIRRISRDIDIMNISEKCFTISWTWS